MFLFLSQGAEIFLFIADLALQCTAQLIAQRLTVLIQGTLNQDREALCNKLRRALEGEIGYKKEYFRAL